MITGSQTKPRSWFGLIESEISNDDNNCVDGTGMDRLQAQVGPGRLWGNNEGEL